MIATGCCFPLCNCAGPEDCGIRKSAAPPYPQVQPQPMVIGSAEIPPKGCICPPGSEKTCQRWDCGRKSPSVTTTSATITTGPHAGDQITTFKTVRIKEVEEE